MGGAEGVEWSGVNKGALSTLFRGSGLCWANGELGGGGLARMAIKNERATIETKRRGGQALSVQTYSQPQKSCGSSMFVDHCAIFA